MYLKEWLCGVALLYMILIYLCKFYENKTYSETIKTIIKIIPLIIFMIITIYLHYNYKII